jgi:methyl halide transferase
MPTNTETGYSVDNKEFWERLYQTANTPWELRTAAPPLQTFLNSPYAVTPGAIAVPGCGTGQDCLLFAQRGFVVTGIDFAPSAIQATNKLFFDSGIAGKTGFLLERDVFQIHEYDGYFDYVLEHCFFSAIHPSRRRTYMQTIRDLLKPGGKLIALWWTHSMPGGPPFGIAKDDMHSLLGEFFTIDLAFVPNNSAPGRTGNELFTLLTRR